MYNIHHRYSYFKKFYLSKCLNNWLLFTLASFTKYCNFMKRHICKSLSATTFVQFELLEDHLSLVAGILIVEVIELLNKVLKDCFFLQCLSPQGINNYSCKMNSQ